MIRLATACALSARRSRDSELHNFLKYVAACWLKGCAGKRKIKPRYEVQMYFPDFGLIETLSEKWAHFIRGQDQRAHFVKRSRHGGYFDSKLGHFIVADIVSLSTSVQIGYTQPFNLLSPLLEGLTRRAVWVPFPQDADRANFVISANTISSVTAYEFKRNSNSA